MVDVTKLGEVLDKFDNLPADKANVKENGWSIEKCSSPYLFELYYQGVPIIRCKKGKLINITLGKDDYLNVCQVLIEHFNKSEIVVFME